MGNSFLDLGFRSLREPDCRDGDVHEADVGGAVARNNSATQLFDREERRDRPRERREIRLRKRKTKKEKTQRKDSGKRRRKTSETFFPYPATAGQGKAVTSA